MPVTSSLKYHDYTNTWQSSQGTWKWTVRMDVSGPSPSFQVLGITSPYGLLRDSIPLPGDVVTKMAETLATLAQTFAPRMLFSTSSITLTLDEGRGFGTDQPVLLTNNGAYGSLLNASATSSASYVKVSPANLSGLAVNASGSLALSADSTQLLAASSPYSATVTVQDANATNSPQTINVSLVVRPKATIYPTLGEINFTASGPVGGPWAPVPSQTFQVVNSGPSGSILDFQIQKLTNNSPWLVGITPSYGTLASSSGQVITLGVVPVAYTPPGHYTEYLRISGYSSNLYTDVLITLTIL